jgi:HAMP domain-containing protein
MSATAFYPISALSALARPSGFVPDYGAALVREQRPADLARARPGGRSGAARSARSDLSNRRSRARDVDSRRADHLAADHHHRVLLVLMWIAAAAIGWFVVDILLIRPLRRLRTSVGNYQPGEVLDMKRFGAIPAQEIRELGETFQQITRTVQIHEADLAEGLVRQTKLTREVHHRVKNNLQVISSLINFHARGAKSAEATEAYASIQRRVDALAVVHRHHYAELEENRGLELRSVIGELAANIRATAPERAAGLGHHARDRTLAGQSGRRDRSRVPDHRDRRAGSELQSGTQVRISIKGGDEPDRAVLRVNSPALVENAELDALLENRYGRVIERARAPAAHPAASRPAGRCL